MHYVLVALFILANVVPESMLGLVEALSPLTQSLNEGILEPWALQICGIAFTSKSSTVLVNSFGPMAYCAFFDDAT